MWDAVLFTTHLRVVVKNRGLRPRFFVRYTFPMLKTSRDWVLLFSLVLVCQMSGVIGSVFTFSAIPLWYVTLTLPPVAPPSWIFGPVWTTLYTLMGIALFMVIKTRGLDASRARLRDWSIALFFVQLFANTLWSILFFGLRNPAAALVDIILLDLLVLATTVLFVRVNRVAGLLLVPYLAWILFATYLNYQIMALNP